MGGQPHPGDRSTSSPLKPPKAHSSPRPSPKTPMPPGSTPVGDRSHVNLIQMTCQPQRPRSPIPHVLPNTDAPQVDAGWGSIPRQLHPGHLPALKAPGPHPPCPPQNTDAPWADASGGSSLAKTSRHSSVALMASKPKIAPPERFCRLAAGLECHNLSTDIEPKSS